MKKRNIVHSALSLSLTAALCLSMAACGGTQTPADSAAASQPAAPSANADEPHPQRLIGPQGHRRCLGRCRLSERGELAIAL